MEESIGRVLQFAVALMAAFSVVLWFALSVWAYRDITSRSQNAVVQIISTLVVVLGFLPGAAIYLLLRPRETIEQSYQRAIEEEYLAQELGALPVCPSCGHAVRDEYIFCPRCGQEIRRNCHACGRLVDADWRACAYCGEHQPLVTGVRATTQANGRQTSVASLSESSVWQVDLADADSSVAKETSGRIGAAESSNPSD